jgi:hypothetical protein
MAKRSVSICAALALALAACGAGAAGPAGASPDSGVRGIVLYGPTCPVQRPGQTCERPYQATVVVSRASSGRFVARTRSAADGRFAVRLTSGHYLIKASSGARYPRPVSRVVSVTAGHFTTVTLHVDSGIR